MAVYEIFSHPELRRYKTHIWSKATFLQIIIVVLTFIPPLLIAYRSHGFWKKVDLYYEQADVHYKHQLIVTLDMSEDSDNVSYVTWSTFQNYNNLQMNHLRVPLIKSREEDLNRDGKNDVLYLSLEMPLLDQENVIAAQMMLMFDYKLWKFSDFSMESMAFIQHSSSRPGAMLQVQGDLKLHQKAPLGHKGNDSRFNTPVIDGTSITADTFELSKVFARYAERNVTTVFSGAYPVWLVGRGASNPFKMDITIRYPEEQIFYSPGFWHLIKWAWVQYAAILLVFLFVFDRIKIFIFQNQLVSTIVERPFKQKAM